MKVAIYARVSTDKQELENQLIQLKQYIESKGYELGNIYLEKETGKYGAFHEKNRQEFKTLMEDAFKHKFDMILVWAMDRFTREGSEALLAYARQLDSWNIKFVSYSESFFTTLDPIMRELMFAFMGWYAKYERIKISERTKAGLSRARKQGKQLGRRLSFDPKMLNDIREMHERGLSDNKIAKTLGIKNSGSVAYARKKLIPNMVKNGDASADEGSEEPTNDGAIQSTDQSQSEGATPPVATT